MKFSLYDVVDLGIEPSKNDFDFEKYKKYVMVVFTLSVYLGINYDGYTFLIELPFEDVLHAIFQSVSTKIRSSFKYSFIHQQKLNNVTGFRSQTRVVIH